MPARPRATTARRPVQDMETGEIHYVAVRNIPRHKEPYTMVFRKAMHELLVAESDTPLKPLDWRVLWYLVVICGYENRLETFKVDIADTLQHDPSSIAKSLKRLESRGIIQLTQDDPGRPWTIVLNPDLFFRGRPGQQEKVRHQFRR